MVSYYHPDGLGSTRTLTNSTQTVTDTYTYDAFGILLDKIGVTVNEYLYTGEFFDANIGFYYLRARYMNPALGRFITQDPFAGFHHDPYSLHKYLYAHANPVNRLDPSGRMTVNEFTVTAGIIGAMSGIHIYQIFTPPEDRTIAGYANSAAGGALIGGLLAYGSYYIYLAPAVRGAPSVETLADKLENNAANVLKRLESISHPRAHFFSRHGAHTRLGDQLIRATTGKTPDGFVYDPSSAARFLTHRAQLLAFQKALLFYRQTGLDSFEFEMTEVIGEGFLRTSATYATTTVKAVFKLGKLLTLFPKL